MPRPTVSSTTISQRRGANHWVWLWMLTRRSGLLDWIRSGCCSLRSVGFFHRRISLRINVWVLSQIFSNPSTEISFEGKMLRNHSEDLRIFFIHSQDADSAFFIFDFKIFCSRTDEYLPNLPRCTIILSENCCSI